MPDWHVIFARPQYLSVHRFDASLRSFKKVEAVAYQSSKRPMAEGSDESMSSLSLADSIPSRRVKLDRVRRTARARDISHLRKLKKTAQKRLYNIRHGRKAKDYEIKALTMLNIDVEATLAVVTQIARKEDGTFTARIVGV